VPTPLKAAWVMNNLVRLGGASAATLSPTALTRTYRQELFQAAVEMADRAPRTGGHDSALPEVEPEPACC